MGQGNSKGLLGLAESGGEKEALRADFDKNCWNPERMVETILTT